MSVYNIFEISNGLIAMKHYQTQAALMKALAHPVRLAILDVLRRREACVCHLEAVLSQRQAYISQQLMQLREAGLIDSRKDGRMVYYWIADGRVYGLLDVLFGPTPAGEAHRVDGCTCPHCAVSISVDAIPVFSSKENSHAHR